MMQPKSVMARQARGAARVAHAAAKMAGRRDAYGAAVVWSARAKDAEEKAAYYERREGGPQ